MQNKPKLGPIIGAAMLAFGAAGAGGPVSAASPAKRSENDGYPVVDEFLVDEGAEEMESECLNGCFISDEDCEERETYFVAWDDGNVTSGTTPYKVGDIREKRRNFGTKHVKALEVLVKKMKGVADRNVRFDRCVDEHFKDVGTND